MMADEMENIELVTPEKLAFDYKFVRLLGEGANGRTWLAKNRLNGYLVAVKELKISAAKDLKSIELFKREAETLQSISVQGVPKFYGSIMPEDGSDECYLIQEYVEYPSLQSIIESPYRFTEAETLEVMMKMAEILYSLENKYQPPIIHRDIKPSNILCCKTENGVQLSLIDFGAVANPQKHNGGSTIAGTFGYMAPEQMLGDVAIQSDYYALGATALHMLTGISPYEMDADVFKLNYEEYLNTEEIHVSNEMKQLLDWLLSPEIEKRPENAEILVKAIQNVSKHMDPHSNVVQDVDQNDLASKFMMRLNTMQMQRQSDYCSRSNWRVCNGVIWCGSMKISPSGQSGYFFEYTFDAEGYTWTGLSESFSEYKGDYPIPCQVRYNPNNPRQNVLL